ncbi:beta-ketoacyl-[acyl-carrier-protein] synthase family protein [Actinocrinis puniceicyclus]|uniref:Beta-ketoacyl-[acyl-carrier-protein] synthase family protein n=1 Tax=Actinocrinis puniceicyclus TaxID=977794 RepID=A0A8J7WR23_9ACTN|nr:beta-ketoacyl synthase N-terminal-like domain-containing protein [Actinocrinis puniceicyclus]MBS2964427.1 beta-ketoacyl-[acyl-carrier-protein] synthase family protein [Actinocrinis puniceicyclus]
MADTDTRPQRGVGITGIGVVSGCGRGPEALFDAVLAGRPAFGPVTRFDVSRTGTGHAAQLPEVHGLASELVEVIGGALRRARLDRDAEPSGVVAQTPVLLAVHSDLRIADVTGQVAEGIAERFGSQPPCRVYTGACVASSTAVADGAAHIRAGRHERVVVAAGYLVEPDTFAVFDAGRALSRDGAARPFSKGRGGLLLGDAVAAVVLEAVGAARRRGVEPLARLSGWGGAGDAYHVCRPRPDGEGLARAIGMALRRAGAAPEEIAYVNANATGSPLADPAEAAALRRVFGDGVERLPVSSTKSVHGHALEASALLELIVTVLALNTGRLPVNAGFLEQDPECRLDLVLGEARAARPGYALSVNSAFGGANTALLVGAA